MANTFISIATVTVGSGGAANVEFTSIPQTYTDLVVKWSARSASDTADQSMNVNSNTSSIWTAQLVRAYDNNATGYEGYGNQTSNPRAGYNSKSSYTANTFGNGEVYMANYAGATNKSFFIDSVNENNSTAAYLMQFNVSRYASTSAITSIKFTPSSGNYAQYSTFTLYGIKNS